MIKDLINIELKDLPIEGLDVHIIKNYVVKTPIDESFLVPNYAVILVKSGHFKVKLKDITQELSAQDLMVLPKNSYCTMLGVQGKLQFFLISFTSDFAFENCLKKEFVDSFAFFFAETQPKIRLEDRDFLVLSLIYKLLYYVNKDAQHNSKDLELQTISFNLFLFELKFILNKYNSGVSINIGRQERLTIQFLTILSIHCKKQHTVQFYAGALFVTPDYLNKILKQVTGKTAKSLVDQAILNEIKNHLENSQYTISSIAQDFEFTSLSKFSDFFKRLTSISPTAYRYQVIGRFKSR